MFPIPVGFLSREKGYVESQGIIIPIHALFSNIINAAPPEGDFLITEKMQKSIDKIYVVESTNSE